MSSSTSNCDPVSAEAGTAAKRSGTSSHKVLGFTALLATAVGIVVGQGALMSILQTMGIAGWGAFLAIFAAFILTLCYVATLSELSLLIPKAGGISSYTEAAIGHFPAIVAVFSGYVVVPMLGLSAELFLVDAILGEVFPDTFSPMLIAFVILGAFTVLNLLGIDLFAKVQNLLAYTMVIFLVLVGVSGMFGAIEPKPEGLNLFSDWHFEGIGVFSLVALAIWGFVGAEYVCPLVEESKNPNRDMPRSMYLGMFITLGVYILLGLAVLSYVSLEEFATSELPHVDLIVAVFGESAFMLIAAVAITGTCSTVNSIMAAVPRMLHGMAHNGQVFPIFKAVNKRGEPWVAVLFMAGIVIFPLFVMGGNPDAIITLLIAASTCWFLTYIIAHIDLMVLRKRYPDANRPYKSPFYPIPQLIGIAGMAYAALNNSPSPEMTQHVYTLTGGMLLVICVIGAVWVKFVMKRDLFEADDLDVVLKK